MYAILLCYDSFMEKIRPQSVLLVSISFLANDICLLTKLNFLVVY